MLYIPLGQITTTAFTADQVLSRYIFVFYVAFGISFLLTPAMRLVASHFHVIDQPDPLRKMHSTPVAYLGGVAVFLGWMAGLALSQFLSLHRSELGWPDHLVIKFSIVAGASIIVVLGLWDDVLGIRPWMKIVGQVFAAMFLLFEGVGIRALAPLLMPLEHYLQVYLGVGGIPDGVIIALSSVFVVCAVVGCCNAANLMDGLDGLCGGVTAIVAAGLLFLAVNLAMVGGGLNTNWDGLRVVISLALLGALLGFIPFNFNPASIFMGDTGSMFLGFACAVMIILMAEGQHPKWFLAAMVIFALPILDTALAFARRWVNRRPLFSADKFHIHHQLIGRGLSVKKTVLILYGLAISFAVLGSAIVFFRLRYALAVYLVIFGSILVAAYKMGMVHERPRVVARRHLNDTDVATEPIEPGSVLEIDDDELEDVALEEAPVPDEWDDRK